MDSGHESSSAEIRAPGRGSLLAIFLTVFIDLLGFGIVLPLLPLYGERFARELNIDAHHTGLLVGLLMASFSAMQFLFLPIWGRLSDRFGRRPIILLGLTGSTLFYFLFGLATAYTSLVGLFIARIGAGIAGATISTAQAYIADTTTKERRARGMALIGAAFALGFTVGPLLCVAALLFGGGDAEVNPWPGYTASLMSAGALLVAWFKLPESLHSGSKTAREKLFDMRALRVALSTPSIGLLILTSFIAIYSFANFESTLSLQIERLLGGASHTTATQTVAATTNANDATFAGLFWSTPPANDREASNRRMIVICTMFAYLGIILTLAQGVLVRRLAIRMSEVQMAVVGGVLAIVGFMMLALAVDHGRLGWLLAAMAIEVIGFAFVNPALQSLLSRRSDPAMQGSVLGLGQSASSLARILGPLGAPWMLTLWPALPYVVATVLMGIGLGMTIVAARLGHDFPVA